MVDVMLKDFTRTSSSILNKQEKVWARNWLQHINTTLWLQKYSQNISWFQST